MDWDLNAIVRSCSNSANNTTSKPNNLSLSNTRAPEAIENGASSLDKAFSYLDAFNLQSEDDPFLGFSDLMRPNNNGFQELQNSCMPFLPNSNHNILDSSISDIGAICGPFLTLHPIQPPPQNQRQQLHRQIPGSSVVSPIRTTQSPASRPRKKKSSQKKVVVQVAAENLCSDVWAWRKYGQKPIKGSPYPRNYYRCSSSKGCTARKQVERSNTDPNLFTLTYTGDHTHPRPVHRNSLAGSVRSKILTNQHLGKNESDAAPTSTDKEINGLSPTTPLSTSMENTVDEFDQVEVNGEVFAGEGVDDDEIELDGEDVLIPNISALDEDLFKGLQQLGGGDGVLL